jgi:hypothetical protein
VIEAGATIPEERLDEPEEKIPDRCKPCAHLWTGGIKNGKHDRWCCKFGNAAWKTENHCRGAGGFTPKGSAD